MSLPLNWIDRIFEALGVVYGQDFLNRWKGMPMAQVKADWAQRLAGLDRHPHAITWALDHLPERPPNVVQFAELCRRAPADEKPRLPQPPGDPERVRAELARIRSIACNGEARRPTDWAHRILAERKSGVLKTVTVLGIARDVAARHPRSKDVKEEPELENE